MRYSFYEANSECFLFIELFIKNSQIDGNAFSKNCRSILLQKHVLFIFMSSCQTKYFHAALRLALIILFAKPVDMDFVSIIEAVASFSLIL